jgi:hypothetical protein
MQAAQRQKKLMRTRRHDDDTTAHMDSAAQRHTLPLAHLNDSRLHPLQRQQIALAASHTLGNHYLQRTLAHNKIQRECVACEAVHPERAFENERSKRKTFACADFAGDAKLEACLNDEDRLKPGEEGETVAKVQKALIADGVLAPEGLTSKYDAQTGQAVMRFKKKYALGFTQYPDVGPGTMRKLDELCAKKGGQDPDPNKKKDLPDLPDPPKPKPIGPVKPQNTPALFCVPFADTVEAAEAWLETKLLLLAFTAKFGSEVQDIWMKYLNNPKTGTKGTLPPRQLFSGSKNRVVKEFREDPETQKQKDRIMQLLVDKVKNDSSLMPQEGQSTPLMKFKDVLAASELTDLPMSFQNPADRIPGLLAGGNSKDASDAGDDVRNVDGQFRVINLGLSTIRIQASFVFDVFDCVDFCPGNPGGFFAQIITIPLSRLEATPDFPTYDVPFEVIYGTSDDKAF